MGVCGIYGLYCDIKLTDWLGTTVFALGIANTERAIIWLKQRHLVGLQISQDDKATHRLLAVSILAIKQSVCRWTKLVSPHTNT